MYLPIKPDTFSNNRESSTSLVHYRFGLAVFKPIYGPSNDMSSSLMKIDGHHHGWALIIAIVLIALSLAHVAVLVTSSCMIK